MIDCHAHAGPGLGQTARSAARLFGRLPRLVPGVEQLAALRARTPGAANRLLELVGSVALVPQVAARSGIPDLLDSMQAHGIEKTIVIGAPPAASNEWLLEAARAHPREVVPVVTLPANPTEATLEALVDAGARGFKIHPNMDAVPAAGAAHAAMFEVAARRGIFVILHTGNFDAFVYRNHAHADPHVFVPLFERHRDVRVCLAHMGRDRPEDVWALMRRFEALYTDTSWQPSDVVRRAIDTVGDERILLGSDWPLLHADLQKDAVDILRRAATDEQAGKIGRTNALRFLGEG